MMDPLPWSNFVDPHLRAAQFGVLGPPGLEKPRSSSSSEKWMHGHEKSENIDSSHIISQLAGLQEEINTFLDITDSDEKISMLESLPEKLGRMRSIQSDLQKAADTQEQVLSRIFKNAEKVQKDLTDIVSVMSGLSVAINKSDAYMKNKAEEDAQMRQLLENYMCKKGLNCSDIKQLLLKSKNSSESLQRKAFLSQLSSNKKPKVKNADSWMNDFADP